MPGKLHNIIFSKPALMLLFHRNDNNIHEDRNAVAVMLISVTMATNGQHKLLYVKRFTLI
jgi:hypothetical protein